MRRPLLPLAGAVAVVTLATVSPATAATALGQVATPGSGVAGIMQSVSVIAPASIGRPVTLTASNGTATQPLTVTVNRTGVGRTTWAPPTSGTWTISAAKGGIAPAQVTVSAMPTNTQVAVPTNTTEHRPSPIIATVETGDDTAERGMAPITGKVVFTEVVRGVIGEARVETTQDGTAMARLDWAPPGVATYAVSAQFVPGAASSTEAANSAPANPSSSTYAPSTSLASSFTAGRDPQPVQLLMPQTMREGNPAYVVVHVNDHRRGMVSLEVDSRKVSPDKPIVDDIAEFEWTPLYSGLTEVRVIFHELSVDRATIQTTSGGTAEVEQVALRHVVEQTVNVLDRKPRNPISITPVVKGVDEQPWIDGSVVEYAAQSRVPLVWSSGNGAPVALAVTGSCAISGQTLLMPATGGGCLVDGSSPGGGGFDAGHIRVIVSSPVE